MSELIPNDAVVKVKRQFTCTVYGLPQPAGSKTPGMRKDGSRFMRDANPKAKEWREFVRYVVTMKQLDLENEQGALFFDGPVRLCLKFVLPRPKGHFGTGKNEGRLRAAASSHPTKKPDLTKLIRGVEDALTSVVWRDDSQVCEQVTLKEYGDPARVYIEVEAIDGDKAAVPDSSASDPAVPQRVPSV